MKKIFITAVFALVFTQNAYAYYGRNSTEAVLTFEAILDVPFTGKVDLAAWNTPGKLRDDMIDKVDDQILHLDGDFHSQEFANRWGGPASCGPWYEKGNFKATFLSVVPGAAPGRVRVKYSFESTIVVEKDPLRRSETSPMDIWMPYAPDLIYDLSIVRGKNTCTDRTENGRNDYYYYWDPWQNGCNLLTDHPDSIQWVTAQVRRLENTRLTYPQYDELYKDNAQKPELNIAIFYGYISHNIKAKKPFYRDDGYQAMKYVTGQLTDNGYEETEYRPHFYIDEDGTVHESEGANVARKMQKLVKLKGREVMVKISMLMSDTDLHAKDPTFRQYVKPAINSADIFIYDGHSGDGDNLSPDKLGLKPPQNPKYQIFFINGCDSYINYLSQFVTARGGLSKLDLVISGFPTGADASAANDWAFLEPFVLLKTLSYQKMLDTLEKSNGDDGTFLVGVKGDEKDTWRPEH